MNELNPGVVQASCLCGANGLELSLPAKWIAHCHCSQCRRAHGAALVTWAGFGSDQVRFQAGSARPTWYPSSEHARRGFCGQCGSSLLFESTRWPKEIHVARAAIKAEMAQMPGAHVFYDNRVPWLDVDDELPKISSHAILSKHGNAHTD